MFKKSMYLGQNQNKIYSGVEEQLERERDDYTGLLELKS